MLKNFITNEEKTWNVSDLMQPTYVESNMDWWYEKRGSVNENMNYRETAKNFGIHYGKELGEFNTHKEHRRLKKQGKQWETYLTNLSK